MMAPLRAVGLACLPAVACALLVLAPASEAATRLQISIDGKRWTDTQTRPLFDPDRRWIPGDREQVDVWARNDSLDRAALSVAVIGGDLPGGTAYQVWVRANGSDVSAGRQLLVDARSQVRLQIVVALPTRADNRTQGERTPVLLRVTLRQLEPGTGSRDPMHAFGPGQGPLSATGSGVALLLPILGLATALSGVAVLRQQRRRRRIHEAGP